MRVNGTDIFMTRGDSETFRVSLYDQKAEEKVNFVEGVHTIYFTVKASTQTSTIVFQKIVTEFDDGEAVVHITPIDTRNLKYFAYVYDVQMNKEETSTFPGEVTTIIKPSKFVIEDEVTYE